MGENASAEIVGALVLDAAFKTFQPCCGDSSFSHNCNRSSALHGLMELAADTLPDSSGDKLLLVSGRIR